ncbi:MAG TPA: hypothetical protein VM577_10030 [Anaerovoracaceae bacterium]|nr:hypothetical protein [Anaerovoracaceae bacterium]
MMGIMLKLAFKASNSGYLITAGSNSLAIENKGEKCNDGALLGSRNALIARNEFKNNQLVALEQLKSELPACVEMLPEQKP